MYLLGEGEYNLDEAGIINVTDSFLGLSQDVTECQNFEPLYNCTTRFYRNSLLMQCGCLPFNIRLFDKVREAPTPHTQFRHLLKLKLKLKASLNTIQYFLSKRFIG